MVAVSRDLIKDELVLHDARAHDGQDSALRLVFSDKPFEDNIWEHLKECAGIPFESTGTVSKLFITAANGKADFVISGDHRIHIRAKNLYMLLTTCRDDDTTGCMIDETHFEYVCPSACRYNRIDAETGKMAATGPIVMQFDKYPARRTNSVLLSPENGVIEIEVQLAQSPALVDPVIPLDECCRKTETEWAEFLKKLPHPWHFPHDEFPEYNGFCMYLRHVRGLHMTGMTLKDPMTFAVTLDSVSYFAV